MKLTITVKEAKIVFIMLKVPNYVYKYNTHNTKTAIMTGKINYQTSS